MDFQTGIVAIVVLVEAVIEAVTMVKESFNVKMIVAGVLGALAAWFFGLDILGFIGLEAAEKIPEIVVQIFNPLLLGVVFLRYSGSLNDLLEWVNGLRG